MVKEVMFIWVTLFSKNKDKRFIEGDFFVMGSLRGRDAPGLQEISNLVRQDTEDLKRVSKV